MSLPDSLNHLEKRLCELISRSCPCEKRLERRMESFWARALEKGGRRGGYVEWGAGEKRQAAGVSEKKAGRGREGGYTFARVVLPVPGGP